LLSIVEDVDRYRFIEPGAFQAGELEVTSEDIIANLPFREGCGMWFDHHITNKPDVDFKGAWYVAPSAARVIYDYYSDKDLTAFDELVKITDRIDSADLTMKEVKEPKGYILASMTIDGKRLQDEQYWLKLIELIRQNSIEKLLEDVEVEERCLAYMYDCQEYGQAISLYSEVEDNVLVTDLRKVWHGEPGNRFLAYTLFPQCNIWVRAMDHPNRKDLSHISVGHSIFNQTCNVNVGELMAKYGGGGHKGAGSCRPLRTESEQALKEIVEFCKDKK
jgi:oligoribonuclease NrnB/cAMP/cGMP phosphodiesterase (DHH superfamily)